MTSSRTRWTLSTNAATPPADGAEFAANFVNAPAGRHFH
jgi:hypothetical protein